MRYLKAFTTAATAALALTFSPAHAAEERSMCVFDIIGANGDIYNIMKDYKTAALGWGVDLELKPYTDEKIAAEDLKAGQCDAAVLTGIRGRQFNNYTGSLDSIGAIPSYDAMRTVVTVLASGNPSINEKLVSGPYEVGGIAPMGAAYLFVKDRTIDTVGELSGKSIAVLEYDSAQASMASRVGIRPFQQRFRGYLLRSHCCLLCTGTVQGHAAGWWHDRLRTGAIDGPGDPQKRSLPGRLC